MNVSALATSCANSQNNSLSPLLRTKGMRWSGWWRTSLRDWFTKFLWPETSSTLLMWPRLRGQWLHLPMRKGLKTIFPRTDRACPLSPLFQRICASSGASSLRIARQQLLPLCWTRSNPSNRPSANCANRSRSFDLGTKPPFTGFCNNNVGQHEEELPPTNLSQFVVLCTTNTDLLLETWIRQQ